MPEPKHERTDVSVGPLTILGGVGLVVTVGIIVAVLFLFRNIVSREAGLEGPRSPLAASPSEYSGPKLQVDPPAELRALFEAEREHLESYGWVDRDVGVVHIPIERAMDLLAERGVSEDGEETR